MTIPRFAAWMLGGGLAPPPGVTRREMTDEEMFRSMLDDDQLRSLDSWRPGANYELAEITVEGTAGGKWSIFLYRPSVSVTEEATNVALYDPSGKHRCFHAVNNIDEYIESSRPYASALAFLCAIQADEQWVRSTAGP